MHLGLSVPGIWYQMHQVIAGKLNVTGLVLPGAPVIICGHNDSIAWGMTNTYVDNLDFYAETINPNDSGQYAYNGEWRKFEVRKISIKIGHGEQVERTLRFTHRGPIVSAFKKMAGKVVSMHWVGDEMSDEFKSIMLLNRANNWNDFTTALKTFTSISQNIVYADKKGNIGLFCAAGVPIRKRNIAFGILPGETDEYDWKGYVPFDELPFIYNPTSDYVASANNRTAPPDYPWHIGTWYSLPSRYERITELLTAKETLSVADFKAIQLDQKSKLAEKYLPAILHALAGYKNMNATESRAYEILKEWDFSMDSKRSAASLFEMMYLQFIRCTYADELGDELFANFNGITSISRIATDQLIDNKVSPWFDDVATGNKIEKFDDMVISAFTKAVAGLEARLGSDINTWEWGRLHHLVLAHPLSTVKILDRVFGLNRGPFSVGGSFHTVSPYSYDNNKPFDANHGASHRHIFDLSNWDNSLTIIPTGNSGIPASKHYCDQTAMYINGQYHPDHFSKKKVVANARYHMKFIK
jgi:penicillin amidase